MTLQLCTLEDVELHSFAAHTYTGVNICLHARAADNYALLLEGTVHRLFNYISWLWAGASKATIQARNVATRFRDYARRFRRVKAAYKMPATNKRKADQTTRLCEICLGQLLFAHKL